MKVLVVIGAGVSGALLALNFLKASKAGVRTILVERNDKPGRGLAYSSDSPDYLLNVPVGNMSAWPDQPDHFLRYCEKRFTGISSSSFVPRSVFGDYLEGLLRDELDASAQVFESVRAEVSSIEPRQAGGADVHLSTGRTIKADHVVLAFGNAAPFDLLAHLQLPPALYQPDPWSKGAFKVAADKPLLLVGAGLTALDMAFEARRQGFQGVIYMLSRHGVPPQGHRADYHKWAVPPQLKTALFDCRPAARDYLQVTRSYIRQCGNDGGDWRDVIAALRPFTAALWQRLCAIERRRFLRHVRPFWDAHRHRIAPHAYDRYQNEVAQGRIIPLCARLEGISLGEEELQVQLRERGQAKPMALSVGRIINCTGPDTRLDRCSDSLQRQLVRDGHVLPDEHGLGLHVTPELAVINRDHHICPSLSYIGPMLKADFWEATAVPELRVHAQQLAQRIARLLED